MKLLLDQGLPRSAASLLQDLGIAALHVGAIGLAEAEDAEILRWGSDNGYVIVTLDADFHLLLALSGAIQPSVVRIRIEGLRAAAIVALLRWMLADCAADLDLGAMELLCDHQPAEHTTGQTEQQDHRPVAG
jgi:predicted nuclease of predicted toxin-antitoxin system